MDRFLVVQYIDYNNKPTKKKLYATGKDETKLIKKVAGDIHKRKVKGENLTCTLARVLIAGKYYDSAKVELYGSVEHYYFIPFETLSLKGCI